MATNSASTFATASSCRTFSVQQQAQIAEAALSLDALTRKLIHDRYEYRFVPPTHDGATAHALEREVQRGALAVWKPFLNPLNGA